MLPHLSHNGYILIFPVPTVQGQQWLRPPVAASEYCIPPGATHYSTPDGKVSSYQKKEFLVIPKWFKSKENLLAPEALNLLCPHPHCLLLNIQTPMSMPPPQGAFPWFSLFNTAPAACSRPCPRNQGYHCGPRS